MERPRRVAGVVGAGLVVVVAATSIGVALLGPTGPVVDEFPAGSCQTHLYAVYESSGNASDVPAEREGTYRNLTERQRAVVDRARDRVGERIQLSEAEWEAMRRAPDVIVHAPAGTAYRTTLSHADCPAVPGAPAALNPALIPLSLLGSLLIGPLRPVVLLAALAGLGYALVRARDR